MMRKKAADDLSICIREPCESSRDSEWRYIISNKEDDDKSKGN